MSAMISAPSRAHVCGTAALAAIREVLGDHLIGLIVKGSTLHGDFFPNYSDLDLHAFVDDEVLVAPQTLATRDSLALQARLSALPLAEFGIGSLQLYVLSWSQGYPPEWVKPWPGTYELLAGRLPAGFTDVDPEQYRRGAHECMRLFPSWKDAIVRRVVSSPDEALAGLARELGAIVKPMAYVAATLVTGDPRAVWTAPLQQTLSTIEPAVSPRHTFSTFFAGVKEWPPTPAGARDLIQTANDAVDDALSWYQAQHWSDTDLSGVRQLSPW